MSHSVILSLFKTTCGIKYKVKLSGIYCQDSTLEPLNRQALEPLNLREIELLSRPRLRLHPPP